MLARVRPVAAAKSSAVAGQIEAATNSNSKRAGELMARHCGVPQKSEDSEVVIDFEHSSGEQHSDTSGIHLRPRARCIHIQPSSSRANSPLQRALMAQLDTATPREQV